MSFDRVFHCQFFLANSLAGAVASFFLVFAANVSAQEAVVTADTSAPSSQPMTEMGAESNAPTLNTTPDSNSHSTTDAGNDVSAEPPRTQYALQITVHG